MSKFSSWTKLKCAVAWLLKLKGLLKELKAKRKEPNTLCGESKVEQFKKAYKGTNLKWDDLLEAQTEILSEAKI